MRCPMSDDERYQDIMIRGLQSELVEDVMEAAHEHNVVPDNHSRPGPSMRWFIQKAWKMLKKFKHNRPTRCKKTKARRGQWK